MFSVAPLHIKDFPHLIGGFRTMIFIQNSLDGDCDTPHILGLFVAVQGLMKKGDETDVVAGKPIIQIVPLIAVITERAGKVFHNDTVDSAPLNVREHPLKIIPFIVSRAGNPVVNIFVNNEVFVAVVKSGDMIFNDFSLVGHAFGFVKTPGILF